MVVPWEPQIGLILPMLPVVQTEQKYDLRPHNLTPSEQDSVITGLENYLERAGEKEKRKEENLKKNQLT